MNNTRKLSLIIIFVALTIALNVVGPKFPAPYAPFLFYEIWEIPIVVAFIALGPRIGIATAVLNTLVLLVAFNPGLPTGPIYNLIAILPMFLGIFIPYRIATHGCKP